MPNGFQYLPPESEPDPDVIGPETNALADVMELARRAITQETPKCVMCGNAIFFYEWTEALTKGHTYSRAGIRETRLSGMCEYCYDEMADELDGE